MSHIGYILKVYPRFSETFIVTEILAREAQGEDISIYALRPTSDARFHPELARVQAPVNWIARYPKSRTLWDRVSSATAHPVIAENFARLLPVLRTMPADEVAQALQVAEEALRDGITHFHAHFASLAGRMAWTASQLTGIGFTVTTHAKDLYHESVDPVWLKRICADADNAIAISKFNEDFLNRQLAGSQANVVLQYNALELDRFPFKPGELEARRPHSPLRVAAVGRLVEKKGFHDLITATHLARERGVDVEVRIAGAGEQADALAQQITELGLDDVVHMLGPQTQEEIRNLLHWGDVFVAPCIPAADGNIDGLSTVVLESMAVGTPVIATAVTGLPEVVRNGETGILLAPGETEALARSLEHVAENSEPLHEYATRARALIEAEFDSAKQAANLRAMQGGA